MYLLIRWVNRSSISFLNDLARAQNLIKMSPSVQSLVVESFKFNGKHVSYVYVKDVGQCLVSKDVYEAIGYEKEDGVKAIQRLFLRKIRSVLAIFKLIWRRIWTILSTPNQTLYCWKNQAFIAFCCVVKSLRLSRSWSGLWKQFCHKRLEN